MDYICCPDCSKSYAYCKAWLMPCCGHSVCLNCVEKTYSNIIYSEIQIRLAGKHKCSECRGVLSKLLFNADLTGLAKCYYVNYLQLPRALSATLPSPEKDLNIFDPEYYVSKYAEKLKLVTPKLVNMGDQISPSGAFLHEYFLHLISCVQQFTNHRPDIAHIGLSQAHAHEIVESAERKSVPALLVAHLFPPTPVDEVNGLCAINWRTIFAVFDENFCSIDLFRFILLTGPRTTFFFKMRTDGLVTIRINNKLKFYTHYSALIVKRADPEAKRLAEIKYAIAQNTEEDTESMMGTDTSSNDTVYDVSSDSDSDDSSSADSDDNNNNEAGEYYDQNIGVKGIRKLSDHAALLYSTNICDETSLNVVYEPAATNLTLALDFKGETVEIERFTNILKVFL